jgi:ELWxxDGT repeat protein
MTVGVGSPSQVYGGKELEESDGTDQGTRFLKRLAPGIMTAPLVTPDLLFFNIGFNIGGMLFQELWISDGTAEGTALFKDIVEGGIGSRPRCLTVSNGSLYFLSESASGVYISSGKTDSDEASRDHFTSPLLPMFLYPDGTPVYLILEYRRDCNSTPPTLTWDIRASPDCTVHFLS